MRGMMILKADISRIFTSPKFYISLCLGLVIFLRPLLPAVIHPTQGTLMQFLSGPLAISDFTPFAALFCVLPFADSFCEDYLSGFVNFAVLRTGKKKFAVQRCLSVALSGGILMAANMLAAIILCAILANQPETAETAAFLNRTIWAKMDLILRYHGFFHYALRIFLAFLFGCLWALVGLVTSVLITNRYVTYVAPFALYQVLWFLLAETAFNPVYMLRGDSNFLPSLWFVLIHQLLLIMVCFMISYWGIRKKVQV